MQVMSFVLKKTNVVLVFVSKYCFNTWNGVKPGVMPEILYSN